MNNWQYAGARPTGSWSGSATFPRELGLDKVEEVYLLTARPVKELDCLRGETVPLAAQKIEGRLLVSEKVRFEKAPVELKLTFNQANNTQMSFASRYGVRLKNARGEFIAIGYDNVQKFFYVDRTQATGEIFSDQFAGIQAIPYIVNTPEIEWTLLIDVASVEFFTAGGRVVATDVFYPSEPFDRIEVFTENGHIDLTDGSLTELKSIWK